MYRDATSAPRNASAGDITDDTLHPAVGAGIFSAQNHTQRIRGRYDRERHAGRKMLHPYSYTTILM